LVGAKRAEPFLEFPKGRKSSFSTVPSILAKASKVF